MQYNFAKHLTTSIIKTYEKAQGTLIIEKLLLSFTLKSQYQLRLCSMDATLLKTPRKKEDWQNVNVLKTQQGSAKQNSILALFVPFHKAFQKGRDTSQRGYKHPLLHPRGASITRPDLRQRQSHTRRKSRPALRQQRPESPAGAAAELRPAALRAGRAAERPAHPPADSRCRHSAEAKHQDLVGDKKRQKGQLCPKRFPAPGFKSASQDSSQNPCCWPTRLRRHLSPPHLLQSHFRLPLKVSISRCLLLNSFLHLSHSQHFLPSGSRSYFCICASHTSPTTLLHTLPFSPSSHPFTGSSHSFEPFDLLASNLSSSTTKRSGDQRKTGGQDGHTTRQVRHEVEKKQWD